MSVPAPAQGGAAVEAVGLVRRFGRPEGGAPHTVLDGAALTVAAGESVAVVGPSGSGKTTLLQIIGALDRPDEGSVRLGGTDILALSEAKRARLRAQRLGFVFQTHRLLPQCDALENVLLPRLALGGRADRADVARARALLDAVGLADRATHRPGQLSVGECQRVAVARALIGEPALLLADEPTGSLDTETAEHLAELLAALRRAHHLTMVLVTHAQWLAERADRVLRIEGGRLVPATPASAP
ncbi:MAG: ABC transporter ATP-binding protein [Deltaproteobacteria bacterium]|nr:ABC transporter ATP-binding protein [Deltaproteobacteria bacterium]